MFPATANTLTYIAIFPLSSHFEILLNNFPVLHHFSLHLNPKSVSTNFFPVGPNDGPHGDQYPGSILDERLQCYGLLAQCLGWGSLQTGSAVDVGNWAYLQEMEPGDVEDGQTWDHAVEHAKRVNWSWKVARRGVFVRG